MIGRAGLGSRAADAGAGGSWWRTFGVTLHDVRRKLLNSILVLADP
jgi:hypothetical protein